MEKDKRAKRTTRAQYEIYLNELRLNKQFRENRFDGANPDIIKQSWIKLTNTLNASGGTIKDVGGWKRVFSDWKCQVRNKARKIRAAWTETGNQGDPPRMLTDLEEELLDITGRVVVDGMSVPELGVDIETRNIPKVGTQQNSNIELKIGGDNKTPLPDPSTNALPGPSKAVLPKALTTLPGSPMTPSPGPPRFKRKRSLLGCLEGILTEGTPTTVQSTEISNLLTNINNNIKELLIVQKKSLKLKRLKLQISHLEYEFVVSSEDEN